MSSSYHDIAVAFKKEDWIEIISPELYQRFTHEPNLTMDDFIYQILAPDIYSFKDDCVMLIWYEHHDYEQSGLYIMLNIFLKKFPCDYIMIDDNRDCIINKRDLEQICIQGNELLVKGMPFLLNSTKLNIMLIRMLEEHGCSQKEICELIEERVGNSMKPYYDFLFKDDGWYYFDH